AVAAFATPAGLYLGATAILLSLPGRYRVPRPTGSTVRHDIREGLRELWRQGTVRRLAAVSSASDRAHAAFFAVLVVFAVGPASAMHLSGLGFSLILTAAAVGAVSGSAAADRLGARLPPRTILTAAVLGLGLCFGAPAVVANPFVVAGTL